MKRSEMITIIADWIQGGSIYEEEARRTANKILIDIEKAGMLPPNIDGDRYYGCYECGGDTVFTWEPEE